MLTKQMTLKFLKIWLPLAVVFYYVAGGINKNKMMVGCVKPGCYKIKEYAPRRA